MKLRCAVVCAGFAMGCGGSSSSLPASSGSAANDVAAALCKKLDDCSHFFVQATYGDVSTCTSRVVLSIANALAAPGTGRTAANLESCAQAIPAASCDDAIDNNAPAACRPVAGTLATGMACSDSSQCVTAFCNVAAGETCGACAAAPAPGATCNGDSQCATGSVCLGSPSVCVTPAAAGAACGTTQPCVGTLVCKAGVCSTPDSIGAACSLGAKTCDTLAGDYCAATLTCTAATFVAAGGTCGATDAGLALCSSSGDCVAGATCLSTAGDGQNCDATRGPPCLPPAVCQNSVCTLPSSSACK